MKRQKIVNWLNGSDNKSSKFATIKWCTIDKETSGAYSENEPIKFLTRSIESSLCDYSDAYILITGNITSGGNDTKAAFKNCAPFTTCLCKNNLCKSNWSKNSCIIKIFK